MRYFRFIIVLLFASKNSGAQLPWPTITQQTKPWARWWWQGSAVNKADISANMKDYNAAGLGGLEVTPIYGVYGEEKNFIKFLSPEWMEMLDHTVSEAKKLGLGIDLANGTGWPFGGPTTSENDASKTVVFKKYTLKENEQLTENISFNQEAFVRVASNKPRQIDEIKRNLNENNDLQALALDQVKFPGPLPIKLVMAYSNDGKILDLTSQIGENGKLNWKAPAGRWTIYALFESLHGKMVERAAPGGEGYAIDHFSKEAVQNYFKKFDEAFKGHDLTYIRALFNDSYEVDDAKGQSNWTPELFDEFQKRRGYDLKKFLPALLKEADEETNSRVIFDYRSTIDELILEYFTKQWKSWGDTKAAIIRNQSHGSPANLLDLYGAIDIPETEGNDIPRYKFATSAGNVTGKPLISSESATWLNEHFLSSWGDVKKIIDLFFLGGVNHIFYHGVNYSPKAAAFPGWLFYAAVHFNQQNPQWKDFHALNEYVARSQAFLQKGKPDNDVLLFYPLDDRYQDPGSNLLQHFDNMEHEFNGTDFQKLSEWMLSHGYTFDFFSDRQLQHIHFTNGKLTTGGNNYQTILLPANKYISERSFRKLIELAKSGASILAYKNLPADVPGLHQLKDRRDAFKKLLSELKFTRVDSIQRASISKGVFLVGEDVSQLFKSAGIRQEILADTSLKFVRRKNSDGYTYFLNNRGDKAINGWISLSTNAADVALFDPMTGIKGIAKWKPGGPGKTQVLVQLQSFESVIVQTFNTKKTSRLFPYIEPAGPVQQIKGAWTLEFLTGGPSLPSKTSLTNLRTWAELSDQGKDFSGSAKYSVSFDRPTGTSLAWLLDLGNVDETAEVMLNGKKIGTLIGPTFRIVISKENFQPTNNLEIIVSNLMANRIAYMDRNNIQWKKFYNINMSARKKENLKNGVFDASSWNPVSSGLLGPVTLTPVNYVNK